MKRLVALALVSALLGARAVRADDDVFGRAIVALRTAAAKDPDRGVRYAAVQALGKLAEPPTVLPEYLDVVAAALADSEWCVRQEAAWWLRRAGARSIPALASVLKKGAPPARASAAWALSGLKAPALPLVESALADADASVRIEALASARRMGLPDAKPLAEGILARLQAASGEERFEAALALVAVRPGDAEAAVPALAEDQREWGTWRHRVEALLRAGPSGQKVVAEMKATDDRQKSYLEEIKKEAADELAGPKEKRAPPDLPPLPPTEGGDDPPRAAPIVRTAAELAKAMQDPERDVRVAAAMESTTVDALVAALKDRAWQVQLAAIRGLGHLHAGAEAVAPFLADPIVALSQAAADALADMGDSAALPTARMVATGHYGVLHHALQIFAALGRVDRIDIAVDIALGKILGPLLSHADENVRETAARCLALVPKLLTSPTSDLARALGDDRLCVVSWAAIALGVRGEAKDAVRVLADPRARVRAYAAFALGWGFGKHNAIDQVPFEVRLPVLDVGETGPVPTAADLDAVLAQPPAGSEPKPRKEVVAVLRRAIRSKDPAVAVRAAAELMETEIDVREAERVMELTLPEGLRRDSPVDLDRLRSTIGSSELPACMMYLCRSRTREKSQIFAEFHRISRADLLPALHWFGRVEEPDALDGWGEIWQPAGYSNADIRDAFREGFHREPGPELRDVVLPYIEDYVKEPMFPGNPLLWLENEFEPKPEDAPLLLRYARIAESQLGASQESQATFHTALRTLWRLPDAASRAYLRSVSVGKESPADLIALAGLARRGKEDARRALIEKSRDDENALFLLLEVDPSARWTLIERLAAGKSFDLLESADAATTLGVRLPETAFLGVEAALAAKPLGALLLGQIAVTVPGCATKRIAEKLFAALEEKGYLPAVEGDAEERWTKERADTVIAFLATADAPRTLALLRRWAETADESRSDWAKSALVRWPDPRSAAMLVAWVREAKEERVHPALQRLWRVGGPEVTAYFREVARDEKRTRDDRDGAFASLAFMSGWPERVWFAIDQFPEEKQEAVRAAVLAGDMVAVRAAYPDQGALTGESLPVWKQIGQAALRGDVKARAEFWSAQRAARYRWLHGEFDPVMHTLGRDPATLPHWLSDLDSNCCRNSDGLDQGVFEDPFDVPRLYGIEHTGIGSPLSDYARRWMTLRGGRWTWSPLLDRFVPQAE